MAHVWRVAKRYYSGANPYRNTFYLNEETQRWVDCFTGNYSRYKTIGEARKALNKKYMYELTNFGDYVRLWKYGVEEV